MVYFFQFNLLMFNNNYFFSNLYSMFEWDLKKTSFTAFSIFCVFDKVNLYILRNIVYKYLIDIRLWNEINKIMLFLKFDVYSNRIKYSIINLLIDFLFQIYIIEVDKFWLVFFSRQNIVKQNLSEKERNIMVFPLCLNSKLKHKSFQKVSFVSDKNILNENVFIKALAYARFVNYILVRLSSSDNCSISIKNLIKKFVYGNLHLFFSFYEWKISNSQFVYFLNYKFCFFNFNTGFIFNKRRRIVDLNWFMKIRLDVFNKVTFKYSLYRIYSELTFYISFGFFKMGLRNLFLKDKRIWAYIFQLESKRCFQVLKLVGSLDFVDIIKVQQKKSFPCFYKASSNLYVFSLQRICSKLLSIISFFNLPASIQSLDNFFKKYNFYFFTNVLFVKSCLINNNYYKVISTFFNKNLFFVSYVFIVFPLRLTRERLKIMGFFHAQKKRIIANLNYLFFENITIIDSYSCLMFVYFYWYFHCKNKFAVKNLIILLKKSCFFTLSRKHNKDKFWSYKMFTVYILTKKVLFFTNSWFTKDKFDFFYCKQNNILLNQLIRYIIC